jgi:hypothetical protein
MFDMASAAHNVETSLDYLSNTTEINNLETDLVGFNLTVTEVSNWVGILDDSLTPLLHLLEETPTRAIILTVVVSPRQPPPHRSTNTPPKSLWSICIIIYLFIAQRATKKAIRTSMPSPKMNKRSIRISLELLTLLLWITGIICAILLAVEYGAIVFSGGVELKLAWDTVKEIIEKAIEILVDDGKAIQELNIVDDIFNIGAMAILAVVASSICGAVSLVSLCASCCISGKVKKNRHAQLESGAAEYLVPMESAKPGFTVSTRSSPVSSVAWTPMSGTSAGYSPAAQHDGGGGGWYR